MPPDAENRDGLHDFENGFLVPALEHSALGHCVFGQLNILVVLRDRECPLKGHAQRGVAERVVRFKFTRFASVLNGVVRPFEADVNDGQGRMSEDVIRVEGQGFIQFDDRFVQLAFVLAFIGEVVKFIGGGHDRLSVVRKRC